MTELTPPVNVAVLGCGRMGRVHVERLQGDPRARVAALFDTDPAAGESLHSAAAPETVVFDDLQRMFDMGGLHTAIICSPTRMHYEQATACLERGLHVLCEKPLADSRLHIRRLIESVDRLDMHLSVGYQRRYWAVYRALRREIHSGRWGDVRAVTSNNMENWQQTIAGTWRDDPEQNPGGFVGDAGSHKIDSIFYVTGSTAVEVHARIDTAGSHVPIVANVIGKLQGDVPLGIQFVGHAQNLSEDLYVHCSGGDLLIRDRKLFLGRPGNVGILDPLEPDSDPTRGFIDLVLGASSNAAPAACALPVFDMTAAILESGRTGRAVRLADTH